ncbi:MAG: ArsR family transcriptional regulator [Candidatus Lokiarchaeota archaeon]|nr:ArsR family transcriptional regulator [Candidatus Lokiarchaeota archaeon]
MSIAKHEEINQLTNLEEEVFNLIKKWLKKQTVFQLESSLINYCSKNCNVEEIEILQVIYSLIQRKIIVPGTSLTQDQILENETRAKMYELIKNKPGIHVRELSNELKKSSSVIRTHLMVLKNFNYIRSKKYNNPKLDLQFLKDFPEIYDDYFVIWKNENDREILTSLINNELNLTELSQKLNVHHSTIQYHLKKLKQLDLIISIQAEKSLKYTFNRNKVESLIKFLDLLKN